MLKDGVIAGNWLKVKVHESDLMEALETIERDFGPPSCMPLVQLQRNEPYGNWVFILWHRASPAS